MSNKHVRRLGMSKTPSPHIPEPAPPGVVAAAATLVRLHGVGRAADMIGISRNVCLALAGGMPVRRGTVALASQCLAAHSSRPSALAR